MQLRDILKKREKYANLGSLHFLNGNLKQNEASGDSALLICMVKASVDSLLNARS